MKRNVLFLLLAALLLSAPPAQAQLFKKIFGGKEQKNTQKRRPQPAKPAAPKDNPQAQKPEPFRYPPSELKARYRVDVLVPLYLDELVKDGKPVHKKGIPDKAEPGIAFYEGLRLAADSLTQRGYRLDVYIHDITGEGQSPETLVASGTLDTTDLIIGLVMSEHLPALAGFAKEKEINFISALSPADAGITNNPYFTLLQPSLRSHCDFLLQRIKQAQGQSKNKALFYHRAANPTDAFAWQLMTADSAVRFAEVKADKLPPAEQLFLLLDSTRVNIIAMPVIDAAYAHRLVEQLMAAFPGYAFEIYGMPSWKGSELLKMQDSAASLVFHITEPFYYDPTASQHLLNSYRKTFSGRITDMTFRGFETLFYYAQLLQRYGNRFNEHTTDRGLGIYTPFNIRLEYGKDLKPLYNENQFLYLMRYQNGNMQVEIK